MKTQNVDPRAVQEEVRQLLELSRVLARTLGFNNSSLARRANVPLASLVRYFKGEGEPKLEFLLSLIHAMGMEVREFFELAYPEVPQPTESRQRVGRIFEPIRPGKLLEPVPPPRPEPAASHTLPTREEIERMLNDLRRDVRELMEERSRRPAQPAETGAKPPKENGEG